MSKAWLIPGSGWSCLRRSPVMSAPDPKQT
jgi:hypothetical protein